MAEFRALLDALPDPVPVLEWGTRWLSLNEPAGQSVALCHGDYRTGNYMVDAGALTGILDWEFASWSDPLEDIGWLCARCWRFGADDRPVGGVGAREDLYAGYEAEAGAALDWSAVPYWEVLATVRWAIIARLQGQRHVSGDQSSLELALTGRKAAEMELDVLTQIRRIEKERRDVRQSQWPILLDVARETLETEIIPHLEGERKYAALMIASAMSIAGREIGAEHEPIRKIRMRSRNSTARTMSAAQAPSGRSVRSLNDHLAQEIREGEYDDDMMGAVTTC